jgi:hypothetical protein
VKKIRKLFQSISRLYEKRFFSDFQSFHFSSQLNVDDTVKDFLIGLYSILYVDLSSHNAQKYFTSTSFSSHFSFTIFCINLLPSQVVHSIGKDKLSVHNLFFRFSLKELKSDLLGFGCNQILSLLAVVLLTIFSKSLKNS